MTDKAREQLSAFLDGEVESDELPLLLGRLAKDEQETRRFERYAAIGAAIRNEIASDKPLDIADSVMAEIEKSPLEPVAPPKPRSGLTWLKPVAGLAVAASVATVTIVAFTPSSNNPAEPGFLLSSKQLPSLQGSFGGATLVSTSGNQQPVRDPRLDRYLLTHNERAVITGMQGVLPYVRIAGFGQDEKKDKREPRQ